MANSTLAITDRSHEGVWDQHHCPSKLTQHKSVWIDCIIAHYWSLLLYILLFIILVTFIHPMINVLDTAASPVIIDSTLKIQGIWRSSPCRWVLLFSFHIGAPKRVGHVSSCNRRKDVAERSILNIAPCLRRGWVSAVVWWFLFVTYEMFMPRVAALLQP